MSIPPFDIFSSSSRLFPPLLTVCHRCAKEVDIVGEISYPCGHRWCEECVPPADAQCPICTAKMTLSINIPQFPIELLQSPLADRRNQAGTSIPSIINYQLPAELEHIFSTAGELSRSENPKSTWKATGFQEKGLTVLPRELHPPCPIPSMEISPYLTPPQRKEEENCAVCKNELKAVGWCMNCSEMLCNDCVAAHQRVRVTKEHHIVLLDYLVTQMSSPQKSEDSQRQNTPVSSTSEDSLLSQSSSHCNIHNARTLAVCEKCGGAALCHICVQQHTNHRLAPPIDVRTSTLLLLNDVKRQKENIAEAVDDVARMIERVEIGTQVVASELKSVIHKYMSALEGRKRDLLQQLETIRTTKLNILKEQSEQLHKIRRRMTRTIREIEASNSPERYYETLLKMYCQKLVLEPQETDLIRLIHTSADLLIRIENMGDLESEPCATTSTVVGKQRVSRDRPSTLSVQLRDACGKSIPGCSQDIKTEITSADGNQLDCQLQETGTGVISISYLPTATGLHAVNVHIRETPLSNCPMRIDVRDGRDYTDIPKSGQLFSFGKGGSDDGELARPWGICIDASERVLVADRSNNRIQIFDKNGNFLSKFGQEGSRSGQFNRPAGIATNCLNQIIVADKDNHRIQVFDEYGIFLFKFGERGHPAGQFNYPWGVACNSLNHIAVSDTMNHRVQIFNPMGKFIRECCVDVPYLSKQLHSPRGVCYLPDDRLLITDFNMNRLIVCSLQHGNEMKAYGLEGDLEGEFCRPQGMSIDPEGNILICDSRNNRIQVFSAAEMCCIASFGGSNTASCGFQMPQELPTPTIQSAHPSSLSPFLTPPLGATPSSPPPLLDRPTDVALSSDGRVYVVDFGNNCIRVF